MKKKIFIILFIFLLNGCANSLFYYPSQKTYLMPPKKQYSYEDIYFKSLDGTMLHGWFFKGNGNKKGTIIHFHGNAQNISAHFSFVNWLPQSGYNLFMFDYRGYGKSKGKPDRDGLYKDCLAALEYIFSKKEIDKNKVFLLGQSLGGAYALAIMNEKIAKKLKGMAIDSAFYSYRQIVQDKISTIPFISVLKTPISYLSVSNDLSPKYFLKKIEIPVIIFHGTSDKVVPFKHSQMIFKKLHTQKKLIPIIGGKHVDSFIRKENLYREILTHFIETCFHIK